MHLTATKELSRVIRWGVMEYGGPTFAGGGGVAPTSAQNAPRRNQAIQIFRQAMTKLSSKVYYKDIWNQFDDLPNGVAPSGIPKWIDELNSF